jgi:hypothetical protein
MQAVNHDNDFIFGEQISIAEVESSQDLDLFWAGSFDNRTDDLLFSAALGLTAEVSTAAVGLELFASIHTGHGEDVIKGIGTASTTVSATTSVSMTVLIEAINASKINSTVVASAFAQAIAEATAVGIDSSGLISTGSGDDLIIGEATANGVAEAIANATADVFTFSDETSSIDSDVFTNLLSQTEVRATAIGIRGGQYNLGKGSDTVIARATGVGVNIGVQDVLIHGGKGHDTFDLQNGTGEIMGGKGRDLLLLEGSLSDYTFTPLDASLGVTIQNSLNHTNLLVSEVEEFQFSGNADSIFQFADLVLA